jgi:hypothetical protein
MRFEAQDKSDVVFDLLQKYARNGIVEAKRRGWNVLCPFHHDSKPSCLVFPTGVFTCYPCRRAWSPMEAFRKLGVPEHVVAEHWGRNAQTNVEHLRPLPTLEELAAEPETSEPRVGVHQREPWPTGWTFRGLEDTFLRGPAAPYEPTLVRLWHLRNKQREVERFPRLALKVYPEHEVYLRLSSQQPEKVYNSSGLDMKDPAVLPFGLTSWRLTPEFKAIIVVEGPYDAMRTKQNLSNMGSPWYETTYVTALLGVGQWKAFREKFELWLLPQFRTQRLILAFDNDEPGEQLTAEALVDLDRSLMFRNVSVMNYDAHDPGDLETPEFSTSLFKLL